MYHGGIMNKFERLKAKIKGYNKGSYYKMRLKDIGDELSIYFELKRDGMRDVKYPKLHLSGNNTPTREDLEAVEIAREKQIYFNELYKNQELDALNTVKKKNAKVIPFFEAQRDKQQKPNTRKAWNNSINHFRKYAGEGITFKQIDIDYCKEFRDYLLTQVNSYSTSTYFSIFKRMLNIATEKGIFIVSPAHQIKNVKPETRRDFLSLEELKTLKSFDYIDGHDKPQPEILNAFLFACFTGLRLSDIINLKWENIIDEDHIDLRIIKTNRFLNMKMPHTAKEIIDQQRNDHPESENVFNLPASGVIINKHLKKWTEQAGITKHVTFHVARHTAACLSIKFGNSIYATRDILGHQSTKQTEIYAKLMDEEKDKAMDRMPKL